MRFSYIHFDLFSTYPLNRNSKTWACFFAESMLVQNLDFKFFRVYKKA